MRVENSNSNNSLKLFFRSCVNGADVGGSICEFFVYMDTDFGRSRCEGIFLYPGWAEPSPNIKIYF